MRKIMKYKLKLDYTEDELEELKELGEDHCSPMSAICHVVPVGNVDHPFRNLEEKYSAIRFEDEFDFMEDINNVVMGTAIFPGNKYFVHDSATGQYVYYIMTQKVLRWDQLVGARPEIKTKDEWLAINPAYEPMLVEIED